jgi:hypothetical protein
MQTKLEEARRRWGTAEVLTNPAPQPKAPEPPAAPAVAARKAA